MTLTVTAFLTARLSEDEAAAREAAVAGATWSAAVRHQALQMETDDGTPLTIDREGLSDSVQDFAAPHIARHDPARVLAEVAAKRAIIEWDSDQGVQYAPLLHLAAVYSDHENYDPSWVVT